MTFISFKPFSPFVYQDDGRNLYSSYTQKTGKRRNDQMVHNFPTSRLERGNKVQRNF